MKVVSSLGVDKAEDRLELLLQESLQNAKRREKNLFDELAKPYEKSLVLYGAGSLGKKTLAGLRKVGIEPLAFIDSNNNLWNKWIDDVLVLSPKDGVEKSETSAIGA